MRRHINIYAEDHWYLCDRKHIFVRVVGIDGQTDAPAKYIFEDLQTREPIVLTQEDFDRHYNSGKLKLVRRPQRSTVRAPDEDRSDIGKARIRRHYVKLYDAAPVPKSDRRLRAFIAEAAQEYPAPHPPPSPGALRRWINQRGEPGDRRPCYMGDRYRRGPAALRSDPRAIEVVLAIAEKIFWKDSPRRSFLDVYDATHVELSAENDKLRAKGRPAIRIPSRATVYRILRRSDNFERMAARFGKRAATRAYVAIKNSLYAERILEKAIGDGTLLDCFVVDDTRGDPIPVGRPYLYVIIDVCSRCILGFVLSFVPESIETAMKALRHANDPKTDLNKRYSKLKGQWVAYGAPRTLLVDNSWAVTGVAMEHACANAGINLEFAPVRTPEYKGILERWFRTLNMQLVHKLPGGIHLKAHQARELGIDTSGKPVLTLSALNDYIVHYIVEIYSTEPHRALEMPPEKKWRERECIDGINLMDDLKEFDQSIARIGPKARLTHKGIQFLGLTYRSEEVTLLLRDLIPFGSERGARRGVSVTFSYHPENLGEIFVYNHARQKPVTLHCTDRAYASGLSEYHHKAIKAYASARNRKFETESERCAARASLLAATAELTPVAAYRERHENMRLLKPYPEPVPTAQAPESVDAPVRIPIAGIENRQDGHARPERKPRGGSQKQRIASGSTVLGAEPSPANPFATFDTDALIKRASVVEPGK